MIVFLGKVCVPPHLGEVCFLDLLDLNMNLSDDLTTLEFQVILPL